MKMDLPWQPRLKFRTEPPWQFLFTPKIRRPHFYRPECPRPCCCATQLVRQATLPQTIPELPTAHPAQQGDLHAPENLPSLWFPAPTEPRTQSTSLACHTACHLPSTKHKPPVSFRFPHTNHSQQYPLSSSLSSLSFTDKIQSMCFFYWSCESRKIRQ